MSPSLIPRAKRIDRVELNLWRADSHERACARFLARVPNATDEQRTLFEAAFKVIWLDFRNQLVARNFTKLGPEPFEPDGNSTLELMDAERKALDAVARSS